MTEKTEFNRKPCELKDHWLLRKGFLLTHVDKFPIGKLTTLAQLFVNIETLGVKYHRDIMKEIEKLGSKVPYLAEFRTMKKRRDIEKVQLKELVKLFHNNSIHNDSRDDYRKYDRKNSYKSNYLANYVLNNESDQRFAKEPIKVSAKGKGSNTWCLKRL